MKNEKIDKMKIAIKKNRVITREKLFEHKEKFHKEQAKLPFEEKINILIKLQEIAFSIKIDSTEKVVWNRKYT